MQRDSIVNIINKLKGEEGHKEVLSVYNSQKPLPQGYKVKSNDAWCATTVSAVFLMQGYNAFSECSCPRMIEKAKKAGLWKEDDNYLPQKGDVIMYDWQDSGSGDNKGVPDHVGIVISVTGNDFIVREGNKGGTFGNRVLKRNAKYIRGFILPPYEAEKKETTTKTKKKYHTVKAGDNLTSIAKKYKTTVDKIVKLNKIKNINMIYPGEKLRIK